MNEFRDVTLTQEGQQFAQEIQSSGNLTVQHQHGFITAQKVAVPRDDARIMAKLLEDARRAGQSFYYEWEVRNNATGGKNIVKGGTIKLAMALAKAYGNNIVTVDVRDMPEHLLFAARFTDLETGWSLTRLFQQRKSQTVTKKDAGRDADIVFQIGQSKAERNVILNALSTYADFAVEEAEKSTVAAYAKDLPGYRDRAAKALDDRGIPHAQVERVIGRPIGQWLAKDLAKVSANLQAIGEGMALIEDLFPPIAATAPSLKEAPPAAKEETKKEPEPKAGLTIEDQDGNVVAEPKHTATPAQKPTRVIKRTPKATKEPEPALALEPEKPKPPHDPELLATLLNGLSVVREKAIEMVSEEPINEYVIYSQEDVAQLTPEEKKQWRKAQLEALMDVPVLEADPK